MIGVGIATYERPSAMLSCLTSVLPALSEYWSDDAYRVFVSDAGSTSSATWNSLGEAVDLGAQVITSEGGRLNVAQSKNRLLTGMLDAGCEYLFLIEDDMVVRSKDTFMEYLQAHWKTSIEHFMFAHHGPRNANGLVDSGISVDYYYECVGSFCFYTRNAIETVGLFDPNFDNCWEHVVHSMLIGDAGLMQDGGWRRWPDVPGSADMIGEMNVPSTHAPDDEAELMASERIQSGLRYWKANYRFPKDIESLIQA